MALDDAYLLDLLLMAKDAQEFTKNHTLQSFRADRQCQYAVIRCPEVIGEVSKRLSPETFKQFETIEWSAMARMRDMLTIPMARSTSKKSVTPLIRIYPVLLPNSNP